MPRVSVKEDRDKSLVRLGAVIRARRLSLDLSQEALADVDAGHTIDHQAVQAWADSLSTDQPLPVPR